uniref:DUF2478 domain-containing protein n=1 Tax=Castellaniella defragrans TaxID=75697 RepID=UPI003340D058
MKTQGGCLEPASPGAATDALDTPSPIAAIVHTGDGCADGPLLEFVRRLQSQGRVVRGLVASPENALADRSMRAIFDLENGDIYPISQDLGKESRACCLNPGALLAAGVVLRRAIDGGADLVVVNRFGTLEANGGGFSAEMLELMSRGRALLTIVSESYLDAWREFTGGMAVELPPDVGAMLEWFAGIGREA